MKKYSQLKAEYNYHQCARKAKIRKEPKKSKRFWMWIWYWISFPWIWLWINVRDWRTAICLVVSLLLWSSSVWIFYLLALITGWTTDTAKWFLGIGSAVWIWWLSPLGSPFILLVTFTTIAIKAVFDKIQDHKKVCSKCGKKRHRVVGIYDPEQDKVNYICRRCFRK